MDNRRLFLAALLSLAVLFLWQWIFPPEKPQPSQPVEQSAVGLVDEAIEGEVTPGVLDEAAASASEVTRQRRRPRSSTRRTSQRPRRW